MDTATATRSGKLATMIRQRIVSGEFSPGNRLPTFQEIESQFSVSRSVAQLAISRLKEDGFLRARTDRGLYVADHPPHLRRYGIVFPTAHSAAEWSRFDEVLVKEARLLEQQPGHREFDVFAGTDDHRESQNVLERLRRETRRDRLAGLIFTPGTHGLSQQDPFKSTHLPKVFVFASQNAPWRPIVSAQHTELIYRGLKWLADRGRRRVALVRVSDYGRSWDWGEFYERAGLEFRPQWVQAVGRSDPAVVQGLIPLLMDYAPDQQPDGLFIADDNLVDHAAMALVNRGLRVGEDIDVVAHCNWPWPRPSMLPIRRIGFHARDLLSRCLDVIDRQRREEACPDIQRVAPLFEDEVPDSDDDASLTPQGRPI